MNRLTKEIVKLRLRSARRHRCWVSEKLADLRSGGMPTGDPLGGFLLAEGVRTDELIRQLESRLSAS